MSGDTVETLLAAYLILGPVGAAAGMMIIALWWLRPRAQRGRIADSRRRCTAFAERRSQGWSRSPSSARSTDPFGPYTASPTSFNRSVDTARTAARLSSSLSVSNSSSV